MNVSGTRKRRRLAVQSALTAVVLGAVAGGIYYTTGAATAGDTPLASSFTCGLPDGDVQVPIEFAVTVPEQASTGATVSVTPRATVTLPAAVVGKLRASGETVDATVTPKLTLTEAGTKTDLEVAPLSVKAMGLPAEGDAVLDVPGTAVQVTPKSTGTATVELTGLTAALTVGETKVDCAATTSQGALGTFEITQPGDTVQPPTQAPQQQQAPEQGQVQTLNEPGLSANALPPLTGADGIRYDFDLEVKTKLAKVGAEVIMTGGFQTAIKGDGNLKGRLDIGATESKFVVFRFMPVSNTVELLQENYATGTGAVLFDQQGAYAQVDTDVAVKLQITQVLQDGVALPIGPNCRTVSDLVLNLKGRVNLTPDQPPSVLETVATIPAFTGCGTTERLDPLMSGLVSGPGNKVTNTLTNPRLA
ncbi:hypothetical protein [Actinokineospora pegani]|uniref:hypothetical protein n=1 Tax=Actinokineospora pegani TaxID=2654637 RepID=UPI0012E9EB1A|nr:hypothetical protein [Actinokineospora pegani]